MEILEVFQGIAAIVTIFSGSIALWVIGADYRKIQTSLKLTQTAFSQLVEDQFDHWELTATEREVALLTIKGFSIAEIAHLRGRSQGTIKSQSKAIYSKADVQGRQQLVSAILDLLIGEGVSE